MANCWWSFSSYSVLVYTSVVLCIYLRLRKKVIGWETTPVNSSTAGSLINCSSFCFNVWEVSSLMLSYNRVDPSLFITASQNVCCFRCISSKPMTIWFCFDGMTRLQETVMDYNTTKQSGVFLGVKIWFWKRLDRSNFVDLKKIHTENTFHHTINYNTIILVAYYCLQWEFKILLFTLFNNESSYKKIK